MQRLFLTLTVFLLAVVPAAAKVAADEPTTGSVTPAGEGPGTVQRQTSVPAQKGRPAQVGVQLDALEAMERLQDLQIKKERRPASGPVESTDDAAQK